MTRRNPPEFARFLGGAYAPEVARVHDDDRPTVDLGPRPPEDDYDPDDSLSDSLAEPPTARAEAADATKTVASPDSLHQLPTQQLDRRAKRSSSSSLTKAANTTTASPVEA